MEKEGKELKRMIGEFLKIERNFFTRSFKCEDETKNLKLHDKICTNLKKIESSPDDFLLKFDSFDINSIFGCFGMFVPSLQSNDPRHSVCYLEAFENISANIAGVKSDDKNNVCIVERELSFEYRIYVEYFRKSTLFPRMISCVVDDNGKNVRYIFEKMTELLGGGSMGMFLDGDRFYGTKIRDQHPAYMLLEVTTFALHVLYGLYVLHEEFGIVHGDISPGNIMFSEIDDIWKLNDFQTAMLLEDSLKTKRSNISTRGFICPVAEKNGFYDKESDIYSVGAILSSTFLSKLKREAEHFAKQIPGITLTSVYELMNIVRDMTKPVPCDRPKIKVLMFRFYVLMQYNLLKDFHIYGIKTIIPRIEKILREDFKKK